MNKNLVDFVLSCGDRYYEEHLKGYNKDHIRADWWGALDFFLARACYQGRGDNVSDLVYGAIIEVLRPYFATSSENLNFEALKNAQWSELKQKLQEKIGRGHVGKERDIKMVLSVLDYVASISDRNIVNKSIEMISNGRLREHYLNLQAGQSNAGIVQVGPKIAAFYLRDVVSLFDLATFVDADSAFCLQPVDAWVRRLTRKLEIASEEADDTEIQHAIIKACAALNVSAFRLNQGIWYFGAYRLEIALELAARANTIPGTSTVPSN